MSISLVVEAIGRPDAAFSWKNAPPGGIMAQVAATELTTIYQRDGVVTPTAVVNAGREASAPLHGAFEWDDTTAAEAHREAQARYLLRNLIVVYRKDDETRTEPTRFLVKVRGQSDDDEIVDSPETQAAVQPNAYVPIQRVMEEAELRRRYIRQAYADLTAWRRRYQGIAAFAKVFEAIDEAEIDA